MSTRKTGVWLDKEKAYLVHLQNGEEKMEVIESDVAFQERIPGQGDRRGRLRFRGGQGGGVEMATQEKSEQKRQQKFLQRYYHEIANHLKDSKKVYIFGPAEAKTELEKELEADNTFKAAITDVATSDKMTENQLKAKVKQHFS